MYDGDLLLRHACSDEFVTNVIVDVESSLARARRCGTVAEDDLRAAHVLAFLVDLEDIANAAVDLALRIISCAFIEKPLIERKVASRSRNQEKTVFRLCSVFLDDGLRSSGADVLGAFNNLVHHLLLSSRHRCAINDDFRFRHADVALEHIRRADVGEFLEEIHKLRQIVET